MAEPRTLYVHRPVSNSADLIAWAEEQGFTSHLTGADLHVTVAFSREPVDHEAAIPAPNTVGVPADGDRSIERFGEGAIVLRFGSSDLAARWQQFRDIGASWDHPEFHPHVTIAYDPAFDISKVTPYMGALELGPEVFAEVDEDWKGKITQVGGAEDVAIALDRATVRQKDADGRLRVTLTPISKANVCPYYGREIPGYAALGLDAERKYMMYRDPEELRKSIHTFNHLPLLSQHVPVTARDHRPDLVVGSTGTDAVFQEPYLFNSLVIWADDAINGVESNAQRELSGVLLPPDMTPGIVNGAAYDGVMRDIVGNHVALVKEGRAGADVLVGDAVSGFGDVSMKKLAGAAAVSYAAIVASVTPRIAMDARPKFAALDLSKSLDGLTAANFKDRRPAIVSAVKTALTDSKVIAKDEDLDAAVKTVAEAMETLEPMMAVLAPGAAPVEPVVPKLADDADAAAVRDFLKARGLSDEEIERIMRKEPDSAAMDKVVADAVAKATAGMVGKTAMDAAISAAVTATVATVKADQTALREAERAVLPLVGQINNPAMDSAEKVYRFGLQAAGVKGHDTVPVDALPSLVQMAADHKAATSRFPAPAPSLGMDAVAKKTFDERNPGVSRIRTV